MGEPAAAGYSAPDGRALPDPPESSLGAFGEELAGAHRRSRAPCRLGRLQLTYLLFSKCEPFSITRHIRNKKREKEDWARSELAVLIFSLCIFMYFRLLESSNVIAILHISIDVQRRVAHERFFS